MVELGPVSGVHGDLTSHDEAILVQLSNVLACRKFIIKFCKKINDYRDRCKLFSSSKIPSNQDAVVPNQLRLLHRLPAKK